MRSSTWFTYDRRESRNLVAAKFAATYMEVVKIACSAFLQIQNYSLWCTTGPIDTEDNEVVSRPCPALYTRAQRLSRRGFNVKLFLGNNVQWPLDAEEEIWEMTSQQFKQFADHLQTLQSFLQRRIETEALALSIEDRMTTCADILEGSPLYRVLLLYKKDFEVFQRLCQHTQLTHPHTPQDHYHTASDIDEAEAIEHIKSLAQSFIKEVYPMSRDIKYVEANFIKYYKQLQSYGIALIYNFVAPESVTVRQIRKALERTPLELDPTLPIVDSLNLDHPVETDHQDKMTEAWRDLLLDALRNLHKSNKSSENDDIPVRSL